MLGSVHDAGGDDGVLPSRKTGGDAQIMKKAGFSGSGFRVSGSVPQVRPKILELLLFWL